MFSGALKTLPNDFYSLLYLVTKKLFSTFKSKFDIKVDRAARGCL